MTEMSTSTERKGSYKNTNQSKSTHQKAKNSKSILEIMTWIQLTKWSIIWGLSPLQLRVLHWMNYKYLGTVSVIISMGKEIFWKWA